MSNGWRNIEHFEPIEFDGPMHIGFVGKLDRARTQSGVPFVISSGFRAGDDGAHGLGRAVDIRCRDSRSRFCILKALLGQGFKRIGVYDKHIHVDDWPDGDQRVIWWGTSK